MSNYVSKKKDMNYQSIDSLIPVQKVIDDADKALNDKSRKIKDSPLAETLASICGAGAGAAASLAGLYFGGSVVGLSAAGITSGLAAAGALVGGGMAAGIFVLAAPVAALGAVGVGVAAGVKNKKLRSAKELTYKNALEKQTAIIKALKQETDSDKERIDYLNTLNLSLQEAIKYLRHDLGLNE